MYQYPYGDTQQLNLDWILTKIKELEQQSGSGGSSIEEVANALISATYNAATQYRRYDYCFLNGKLYRCLSDTTGVFNPADWQEVLIGDDIPILTRLINAVDASLTSLQTTVGNQGNAITNLQNAMGDLDSDDVDNASTVVSGATVTAALETLDSAIDDNATAILNTRRMIANVYESGETATSIYRVGELIIYAGYTAQVIAPIAVGDSFIWNTNIKGTTISTELFAWASHTDGTFTLNNPTDTLSEARFIQKGRICEVHFCITRSGGFTAGTEVTLGNLSVMQRPPVNIRTINGCGAAVYSITGICFMILGASGNIVVTPLINCNSILVDFVYLAD